MIGDDTGEIRLVGWEQSSEVRKLNVGENKDRRATVNSRIGSKQELTLRQYSSVINIS